MSLRQVFTDRGSYASIYTSVKVFTECLIYCILSNGEVIKYHLFISVVVKELSVRCLNTGPEDRLLCGYSFLPLMI